MSDPPLSDIDFKNKMTCVWTTLKIYLVMISWSHYEHQLSEFIQKQLRDRLFLRLNWEHSVVKQWTLNYILISQKVKNF